MIIAIDFDGTIVKHKFPKIGEEVPLAIDYIKQFQKLGAKLILYTMRSDGDPRVGDEKNVLSQAMKYCYDRGIYLWGVNENPHQKSWTSSPKVYAQLYIDDAAFGCPLIGEPGERPYVDWSVVGPAVIAMLQSPKEVK